MTFTELDTEIKQTKRQSLGWALIASVIDYLDDGRGLDLDEFLSRGDYRRDNTMRVASQLQRKGILEIHYYSEDSQGKRTYVDKPGAGIKSHYRAAVLLRTLFRR